MTTSITLRSTKGSALTHNEMDTNLTNLQTTADNALAASDTLTANKAEAAALGVANTDQNMGSFTGTTISDNVSAKVAIQSLETAVETKANATALGVTPSAADMGTFTGTTIADSQTGKQALQALETAVETKANASAVGITASAANMGTYTGSTITDNQTAKQNIQELETSVETKAPSAFSHSTSYSAGTVGKKLQQFIDPMDAPYNATGDGTANDYTAFSTADIAAAAAGLPLFITKTHRLNTSYTPTADLFFIGGKIKPASGTTFTVNKAIAAPCTQIFDISLTGTVVLNDAKIDHGYFEWFGVIADSSGAAANNATYMNAAIIATPKIIMTAGDYYTNATIKILTPNHIVAGQSSLYDSTYGLHATRILMTDGSSTVLQIGPDSNPGAIAQFPEGIKVSGIQVSRTVAPVISSGCRAIHVRFVLEAYIEDVRGDESMFSWDIDGTVSTRIYNCSAKRTSAGTGAGSETWRGFYINGNSGIAAGGNASLYLAYCHADDTRAVKTDGNGFYADVQFTDLFLDHCETVSCTTGMNFQGNASTGTGAVTDAANIGNTDVHIINPINDSFATYGIYINALGAAGSIDITSPYFGPASGATAALKVLASPASVNVTGGQFAMHSAAGTEAISIETSSGVRINGAQILETTTTGVELITATNCVIMPTIKNKIATGGAGVQLTGVCTGNYIAPTIFGKATAVTYGIQVTDTNDDRNEYNCTGIASGSVNGGSGNKLVRNGVQITAAFTLTGTNTTSGVMT